MLSKISLSTFVAAAALVGVARADVTPSEPGPGSRYQAGSTCTVTWNGDAESTTAWKDMSIQLMTGSNFEMFHLTTIATQQDGTVDGRFTYPCPEVNPYSAIYFYQFTAPGAPDKTWTTRFTIASASGETTPPSNPTQPGTNEAIPWGRGALVDASSAVPAPASAGGAGAGAGTGAGANSTATTSTTATTTPAATTNTTRTSSTPLASTTANSTSNSTSAENAENAANSVVVGGSLVLGSVVALASSALALALSL